MYWVLICLLYHQVLSEIGSSILSLSIYKNQSQGSLALLYYTVCNRILHCLRHTQSHCLCGQCHYRDILPHTCCLLIPSVREENRSSSTLLVRVNETRQR